MNLGSFNSSQITLMAQHDSSRHDFPALITALCKARGVHSDSLTHERLSPAINLAQIKKKCWNLDDLSVTFRGPRKAKGRRSEAPPSSKASPSSAAAPIPFVPFASTFVLATALSTGPTDFIFTPQMLHSMLQSIHRGSPSSCKAFRAWACPPL